MNYSNNRTGSLPDTVSVAATSLGLEMLDAKPGSAPIRLAEPGDNVVLRMGSPVQSIILDIDPDIEAIESVIDDELGTIVLRVVSTRNNIVRLERKCQTIERVGAGPIPSIDLAPGLQPEQIVITPLCDKPSLIIGYSIRYGSVERGCKSEARAALRGFARCSESRSQSSDRTVATQPWRKLFRGNR
jgi:hypothetical protein